MNSVGNYPTQAEHRQDDLVLPSFFLLAVLTDLIWWHDSEFHTLNVREKNEHTKFGVDKSKKQTITKVFFLKIAPVVQGFLWELSEVNQCPLDVAVPRE